MKDLKRHSESAIALLFTLILVATFFILGMAFMAKANFSANMSQNLQDNSDARAAANLALENIKGSLQSQFSTHLNNSITDFGYTYPVWEMKRIDKTNFDAEIDAFIDLGNSARGITSQGGQMGETGHYEKASYNQYGTLSTITPKLYYNLVVDSTWQPSATDPSRSGYRYGYFLVDKSGLLDINSTNQNIPATGLSYSAQNTNPSYTNYDLSKVWSTCNYDPSSNAVYTFDELLGYSRNGTQIQGIPSALNDADIPSLITAPSPYTAYTFDTSTPPKPNTSYRFLTSPFTISENFPAYNNNSYDTIEGSKTHDRFDLTSSSLTVSSILTGIPYLNRWTDNTLKNTVAANIKDYIDSDIVATYDNYTPIDSGGGTVTSNTYCGNERVPYINEVSYIISNQTGEAPLFYLKAELVWLYGDTLPSGVNNYTIKVKATLNYDAVTTSPASSTPTEDTIVMELQQGDSIVNNVSPNEFKNYFVSQYARFNLESKATQNSESSHSFNTPAGTFSAHNVIISDVTLELHIGSGNIVDIVSLPVSASMTSTDPNLIANYQIECNDPRNNTHPTTDITTEGGTTTLTNWQNTNWDNSNNPIWRTGILGSTWQDRNWPNDSTDTDGKDGSMGSSNRHMILTSSGFPGYPSCDNETATDSYYINLNNGEYVQNTVKFQDPAVISNRYMPSNGGILHEVELGQISRGAPWQTINLTEYNLENPSPTSGDSKLIYAQFAASSNDTYESTLSFYDPVSTNMCNGGDREILDHVYIDSSTLNDISTDKEVYGKINPNTWHVNSFKILYNSLAMPKATEAPNAETGSLSETQLNAFTEYFVNSTDDSLSYYRRARLMTKYTYDKTQAITATNSPSDPMRWGSKRYGSYFGNTEMNAVLSDRERESLVMKTKDYISVRYTYYSGVILGDAMNLIFVNANNPDNKDSGNLVAYMAEQGVLKIADEVVTSTPPDPLYPAGRAAIWGKASSQNKYLVELAYDHFLDKVTVLDFKYAGKEQ